MVLLGSRFFEEPPGFTNQTSPGRDVTFLHEFRHLMEVNDRLDRGTSLRDSMSGRDQSSSPYEGDADRFAREFLDNCAACGITRVK